MANTNIINAVFGSGICAVTTSAFRANYGMVLRFSGIDLPTAFEVDFSNYDVAGRDSVTAIGQNGEVQIPDDLWDSGLNIYAYVYLHPTDDSGVTVYTVTIPVLGRPNRTEETPTPHEQTVIEQAISALNDAVEQTAADVEAADASASAAAQSEANASVSERSAAASASAALASQNAAESAQQGATESASGAAESARNAANSASAAAESATNAQASAEQAERSVQSISGDVERAERAAATATDKATAASGSAATASNKATEAGQSATAAAQSAQNAASAAQNAASSATAAESHATDAEQAKSDAQAAQAAAEQAAESVSGLSEQIAQNTADIADSVQSKAGALIDTATGSIASFVPDSTVPTVRGLTVDIEPVQDLHGYDNPWPSGGGKNKFETMPFDTATMNGITFTYNDDGSITVNGTATGRAYRYFRTYSSGWLELNETYTATLSGLPNTALSCFLNFLYSDNGTTYSGSYGTVTGNNSRQLVPTHEYNSVLFDIPSGQSFSNNRIYVQIEKGTTSTSWTPYSNICPISGWDEVEVQRTGKNLWKFDSSFAPIGYQVLLNRVPFDLKAGTYTFSAIPDITEDSIVLFGYHADGTRTEIARLIKGTTRKSATATISKDVVSLYFVSNQAGTISDIQLELGSTATDYEPYQGDTYTIQLGQTVYGCKIYATQGKMVVTHVCEELTANMDWNTYTANEKNIHRMKAESLKISGHQSDYNCSHFKKKSSNGQATELGQIANQPWNVYNLEFILEADTTNAEWKQFLTDQKNAGTPVQLWHYIATPITVDLTPLEISVLTGQTNNIWADSGDVSVDYAADLKTYINNKIAAAVAALS